MPEGGAPARSAQPRIGTAACAELILKPDRSAAMDYGTEVKFDRNERAEAVSTR
jgi:hypothetical protein